MFSRITILIYCVLLSWIYMGCSEKEDTLFKSIPAKVSGINFQNKIVSTPELNILNYIYFYNGAGVAVADFNNDGLDDIYFTSNQELDQLYLNKGGLRFSDITSESNINNSDNWTTGVTTVDINQDGWMDIYICKMGSYKSVKGKNLLYVNQGLDENGLPVFKEDAASFGLDFMGFSTQATFFDYDLDGDLDMFLLNHSINPNQNYGRGKKREEVSIESGDKLFENTEGVYVDISSQAGIFQSKIGYGLGVSVSDINLDGYPDLYVGNDFYENDYLYMNQGDKTFKEVIHSQENFFGHTSHFSMGNDIADVNNDGLPDILSLDMLPEDMETFKSSGTEFNFQIYQNYINNGYSHQYMQNTLQLNRGNGSFSETAHLSGIAATEWSWSPLIADFDNDGYNDMYITNGILGATNDMDFINFIADEEIQRSLNEGMNEAEMAFIDKIPSKKTNNYFFRNQTDNTFANVSTTWSAITPSYSNGAAYSDFDNDGDLDLVVNNVNEDAFFLENSTSASRINSNYLILDLKGKSPNRNGIGAHVKAFYGNMVLSRENFTSRGYLSSVSPNIHLGLGQAKILDSLHVIWPDRSFQVLYKVEANQKITIDQKNATGTYRYESVESSGLTIQNNSPLFSFRHKENTTLDFNRDPLIPYALSNEGPDLSIADVDQDGFEDVFIGGAKGQASELLIQNLDGTFTSKQGELFEAVAINEDVTHSFFDADGDSYPDLIVASGGNEFTKGKQLIPRFYRNDRGIFKRDSLQFEGLEINASKVEVSDIDNDGDQDLLFLSNTIPQKFGSKPTHYLYTNDGLGNFVDSTAEIASALMDYGPVSDAEWADINDDGSPDLVVVGQWMPISVFYNRDSKLQLEENIDLTKSNGWWKSVVVSDLDNDGDLDIVAGNWGLNSRLKASKSQPITLYNYDFDQNGKIDPVVTYFEGETETPFASKDDLVKQIPELNKDFLSYSDFARASIEELFSSENLNKAEKSQVFELASCYFENDGKGGFIKHLLPFGAQISSVNDIALEDFNNDGFIDLFLIGNNFEISTQLSRLDASHGVLLLNDTQGNFKEIKNLDFDVPGPGRTIKKLTVNGKPYLVIARNNDQPVFLKID